MKTAVIFVSQCPRDTLLLTHDLDPKSELAYRRICDFILSSGDKLRDDDALLSWMTKTGRQWKRVKAKLLAHDLIVIEHGRITSRECQASLAAAERSIAQRRDAGTRSAELRNANSARVDPPIGLTENETDPTAVATNHKPLSSSVSDETSVCVTRARSRSSYGKNEGAAAPDPIELDREFDDLFRQWPRGERAVAARAEYHRKRQTVNHAAIANGVMRVAAQRRDPRFVPHFAKWLAESGWSDQKEFFLPIDGDQNGARRHDTTVAGKTGFGPDPELARAKRRSALRAAANRRVAG